MGWGKIDRSYFGDGRYFLRGYLVYSIKGRMWDFVLIGSMRFSNLGLWSEP